MGCPPTNCTAETTIDANPDIAGIGVLLSFIITFIVSMLVAFTSSYIGLVVNEKSRFRKLLPRRLLVRADPRKLNLWNAVLKQVLLSFSDQQIVIGIAIQCISYFQICSMPLYHAKIIGGLALMSSSTHVLCLVVLGEYFYRNPLAAAWRRALLLLNALLIVGTIFFLFLSADLAASAPAYCVFSTLGDRRPSARHIVTLVVLEPGIVMFVLFGLLFVKRSYLATLFARYLGLIPLWALVGFYCVVALPTSFIALIEVLRGTQVLGSPIVDISGSESEWGFGQVLPLVLLGLPVLNAIQCYSEETSSTRIHNSVQESNGATEPLLPVSSPRPSTHQDHDETDHELGNEGSDSGVSGEGIPLQPVASRSSSERVLPISERRTFWL